MSSLPTDKTSNTDKKVTAFFNQYYTEKITFPSNEVDAVVAFFTKRGFEKESAISTATTLLTQAKLDNVKVFDLLDTLKGLSEVQLSSVVAEILNYARPPSTTIGYKRPENTDPLEKRNIIA